MKEPGLRARTGLEVPMADGVRLRTDVFLPAGQGPFPAVVLRTYLGKSRHLAEALGWVQEGFACVVQDVRGRYDSEGDWKPFAHEREDGRATFAWLAGQPFCDGRAAAVGGSYAAFTAWAAALAKPPGLVAVISSVPAMHPVGGGRELSGILPLLGHLAWWTCHGDTRCSRDGLFEAMLAAEPDLLLHLPLASLPERLWAELPGWLPAAQADHPPVADEELEHLEVASLHLAGWHDPFVGESLRQFELTGAAVTPRPPRALVVGPFTHQLAGGRPASYGERSYGPASRFALGRFAAQWLRGVLTAAPPPPTIHYFLCGRNCWTEAADWPPPETSVQTFYAAAAGGLEPAADPEEGADAFVYDPADPFPARRAPLDESDLLDRRDLVRYTTAPFAVARAFAGAPRLRLWATTDGKATDWVARLLEVTAEGRLLFLSFGAVDAGAALARRGLELQPGAPCFYEIELAPLACELPAGHRLRLEITSSAFPACARNLNTGESRLHGSVARPASQAIHRGGGRATALALAELAA